MKGQFIALLLLILVACGQKDQETATVKDLPTMPMALTNAAVTAFEEDSMRHIYVFGGLGEGKTYADITLSSFMYDVEEGKWSEIAPLPDTLGKIAAAASQIGDKLYIAGGYHVFADGHELSSDKVHIYEPAAGTFLPDASPIPVAIDDHVQAVYGDSLLYLVSGWHDTANVNLVQIYDPANDIWQKGTPLPDTPGSYVFGASGIIVGDTIYMAGGAGNRVDNNFPIQPVFTKGYIHPEDPTLIDWKQSPNPDAAIYRGAAFESDGEIIWAGGAADSYNYDGISYTGKPVSPRTETLRYDPATGRTSVSPGFPVSVMDLRGLAAFSSESVYLTGGMLNNQKVTDSLQIVKY